MAKRKETPEEKELRLKEEKEAKKLLGTNALLKSFLNKTKEEHFNFEEQVNYRVSTGSIILDCETDGGLCPGLHRAVGITEGGKTSFCLEVARNFLKMPGTRGLYIKAEGRLGPEISERSGVKLVFKEEDWVDGTMFVFETNIYEVAVEIMTMYIQNNPEKKKFIFILDSVDGLTMRGDVDREYEESNKVAGGAVVAGNFMKRISIPLAKRGHMALFISQVRSDIKLDPYSKAPVRLISGTGGNALMHFANWIFEFEPKFRDDIITKNEKEKKIDPKTNPIVGHWAKVTIRKSTNEKTGMQFRYPIKHGRSHGKSVWIEKEIVDMLQSWALITRGGSWYKFDLDFYNEYRLEDHGLLPQYQGIVELFNAIENSEKATKVIADYIRKTILEENGISNDHRQEEESQETAELQD